MAATKANTDGILQSVLVNFLVSQARTVEGSVNRALRAVLETDEHLASEVFLTEPRINEMEILIDEHAIRTLCQANLLDADVRLIVATLKINNDLERMGDLAVNLGERAISLADCYVLALARLIGGSVMRSADQCGQAWPGSARQ